ncbi:hypothetical protein [Mycolicibacterium palauense]|uniref:hypothetical protein n=1 Tax=Mycolicibacterium palauense TaxID=2034511 RepID=UPI001FECB0F0|nr:hypothetical protein [Mycolicibacterium palauense]
MTHRPRSLRAPFALASVLVLIVGVVAAATALHHARVGFDEQSRTLAVGDCVIMTSTPASPPAGQTAGPAAVTAHRAPCNADPSYTIGALTGAAGACPSSEYQHFPAPAADARTAALCLVPNLLAEHCYLLQMPMGLVSRAECVAPGTSGADAATGVLVQVTNRLEVRDQRACPTEVGHYVWPYPSPARTYCTLTVS